ncbi:MAG: hypothetical protein LIR46_04420 [Bacteroidota bacterium]|nr:hypothetical protein [Bacteroidota bacterium]
MALIFEERWFLPMMQALTTTFTSRFPEEQVDVSTIHSLVFTLKQGQTVIVKSGDSIIVDGQTVSTTLTQEEALKVTKGNVAVQWNWLYANGARGGSRQKTFAVEDNLYKEVMT